MTAAVTCRTCGAEPRAGARFCDACGAPIDVDPAVCRVQASDGAVRRCRPLDGHRVGGRPERLREIMAELLDRSTAVVKRYGGTVSQFTGDGIMAVFGAPVTLEDHAFAPVWPRWTSKGRYAFARSTPRRHRSQLRIGLNSGQVIAGEIGSSSAVTQRSASKSAWRNGWNRLHRLVE